jgi:cysteine desulfuration protein SufE
MARGHEDFIISLLLSLKPQYFVNMTDMPTLNEIQQTFSILDNWEDKYAYLIDLGRKLPAFSDENKNDNNLVRGCTSRVWMIINDNNGIINIKADSDAHIVRGLIALVIATYNGKKISEIKSVNMEMIFSELGLSDHLSPNRRNGFFAMVEKIKSM